MFETAELGRTVSKKEFDKAVPQLRVELVALQQRLRRASFPVVVLFGGVDGAGKSESLNLLNEWMDPRGIETNAYPIRSDEERGRPALWRFWRDLPPKGKIGLFLSAWYTEPILDHAYGRIGRSRFERILDRVAAFERLLADDGVVVLKFWMHLSKDAQRKRLEELEDDPITSWRVTATDWERYQMYDRFVEVAERCLRRTSTGQAPWKIVEGVDHRYRSLAVATVLRDAVLERFAMEPLRSPTAGRARANPRRSRNPGRNDPVKASLAPALGKTVLSELDMSLDVGKKEYELELVELQKRVGTCFHRARDRGMAMVVVFEGWDAAGKGGTIRRLTRALDARDYRVFPISAPSDEEKARHYLWRFWRRLPGPGRTTIFDRSWYGRVLVERVERFATDDEWQRAYGEINDFERQLTDFGMILLKFWLNITRIEQLRRFEQREHVPYKQWKITDEDWRNREKWDLYEAAVQDMVERTSTSVAPWTLVEANSKRYARLKVLRTVAEALEDALEPEDTRGKKKKKKGRGGKSK